MTIFDEVIDGIVSMFDEWHSKGWLLLGAIAFIILLLWAIWSNSGV